MNTPVTVLSQKFSKVGLHQHVSIRPELFLYADNRAYFLSGLSATILGAMAYRLERALAKKRIKFNSILIVFLFRYEVVEKNC